MTRDPGIVECHRKSKFVPIEWIELLEDEETIRLGMNGVCSYRASHAGGAMICSQVRADAGVIMTLSTLWG